MGGRGGASGLSNGNMSIKQISSKLPDTQDLTFKKPVKELTGTPDQVKQAEKIRRDLIKHYLNAASATMNPYNPSASAKTATEIMQAAAKGKEEVAKYVKEHSNGDSKTADHLIERINKLSERVAKLNYLSQQKSAEWWIKGKYRSL